MNCQHDPRMECVICGKSLTGGSDTFGPRGIESCCSCWLEYGISGPHDPWEHLNIACGTRAGDVRLVTEAENEQPV